jgi:hypothetical protein
MEVIYFLIISSTNVYKGNISSDFEGNYLEKRG